MLRALAAFVKGKLREFIPQHSVLALINTAVHLRLCRSDLYSSLL